ncbi:MAG: protein translocase subunit SecF [Myxococcales bacterium]|nr:protein translocase subunit SecF [Myxococcales bacterium]
MFTLIKPDTKFDFMGKHRLFFTISAVAIVLSLASLAFRGLNKGIDFVGGTKIIVSFKKPIDRDQLRKLMTLMVERETGSKSAKQVDVQDFARTTGLVRYAIQTEISSFLTAAGKKKINTAFLAKFGKDTVVDIPEESGGRLEIFLSKSYLNWKEDKNGAVTGKSIDAVKAELIAELNRLGYSSVEVTSDKERTRYYQRLQEETLVSIEKKLEADWFLAYSELLDQEIDQAIRKHAEKSRPLVEKGEVDTHFIIEIKEVAAKVAAILSGVDAITKGKPEYKAIVANFDRVESASTISASVGESLFNDGLLAILYALIGILAYIAIRFEFKFSPGAVVALAHDVIITMGVFSALSVKFTLPIIAALLTIVGYSLNDTIVVYDRIRENLGNLRGKKTVDVINLSVNETLSRTILTSGTTLLVVISILFFAGGQIFDFALALFIGIFVGTYSSIFIASPVTIYAEKFLEERAQKGAPSKATKAPAK